MKRLIYLFTIILCTGLIFLSSCKKDDVPNIDDTEVIDDPDGNDDADPDDPDPDPDGSTSTIEEINAAFTFNSASFKSGTPPTNANLGDLKVNKDTINIWPGIQNRVSILNHTGISISGVILHMPGADGYHDAEIEPEESNDTLAVFYVDMDPLGLDLPYNGNILIKPSTGSGEVIDEFDHPIHVDTPFDENVGAGPQGTGQGSCSPASNKNLFWAYTIKNNAFSDAPNFPSYQSDYSVDGCCDDDKSYISCHPAPENANVDVTEQYARTDMELIKFFADGSGDFVYLLHRTYNDYWPEDTDFCSRSPGYKLRQPRIDTLGKYIVSEENSAGDMVSITITNINFTTDDLLNYGFGPIPRLNEGNSQLIYLLGCRYYIETILVEGQEILRVFENVEDFDLWYD
jgi:hypothetical protein